MNLIKSFFSNLHLFSNASLVGAMASLSALHGADVCPDSDVAPRRCESHRLLWCDWRPSRLSPRVHKSHQSRLTVSVTGEKFKPCEPFFLLSLFFISLFSLLSPSAGDRHHLLLPHRCAPSSGVHSPPTPVLDVLEGTFSLLGSRCS
jgi:hypothetical protein